MIKNKPDKSRFHSDISKAFDGEDMLQFVFFYRQLEKLKSNRENYHIEFVLKECYPALAPYSISEIENYIQSFR